MEKLEPSLELQPRVCFTELVNLKAQDDDWNFGNVIDHKTSTKEVKTHLQHQKEDKKHHATEDQRHQKVTKAHG
jgi:hypothetical protein